VTNASRQTFGKATQTWQSALLLVSIAQISAVLPLPLCYAVPKDTRVFVNCAPNSVGNALLIAPDTRPTPTVSSAKRLVKRAPVLVLRTQWNAPLSHK